MGNVVYLDNPKLNKRIDNLVKAQKRFHRLSGLVGKKKMPSKQKTVEFLIQRALDFYKDKGLPF